MPRLSSQPAAAVAVLLSIMPLLGLAAPAQDAVPSLPGFDGPLPSKHYSGYLPTGKTTGVGGQLHYWLIEAENHPETAPVALWLNGGPGSSSLIGLLTENGQVATNANSLTQNTSDVPKLFYNPYSWSQVAHVVYLEQPKGVGFSYCEDPETGCTNTDESTAEDAYEALVSFFDEKFPEYKTKDFYITGESYAGTYIPMLMDVADRKGGLPNLKGAAIGDGCYGNSIGLCGNRYYEQRVDAEIFAGHVMYPLTLYSKITAACPTNFSATPSLECKALYSEMESSLGEFNTYNIYDQCPASSGGQQGQNSARGGYSLQQLLDAKHGAEGSEQPKPSWVSRGLMDDLHPHPQLNSRLGGALNDWICGGEDGMAAWLSHPKVQSALHVSAHAENRMSYRSTVDDLRPVYKRLAQKYRLLIYSGDADACVPYYASETWTRELGFTEIEAWRPWTAGSMDAPEDDSIRAGYVITYATQPGHNFTFATVAGAGHMVPTHKPPQALALLKRFLANEPL